MHAPSLPSAYGTAYYPDHWPESDWARDLDRIAGAGLSLVRFGGDKEKADAVYAGVVQPLLAEDVADAIAWVATRPSHVDIDELVIKPRAQAAAHKVHRA